jgi:hypothetical protein
MKNLEIECEAGWIGFKNFYCYKLIINNMDHFTAQQECESINSTIVSIHSYEENEFLLCIFLFDVSSFINQQFRADRNNQSNAT